MQLRVSTTSGSPGSSGPVNGEAAVRGYHHVVEADIKGFFDNLSHEWLMRMLAERIDDQAILRLIKKWLKAGVLDTDGKVLRPEGGTPQGGIHTLYAKGNFAFETVCGEVPVDAVRVWHIGEVSGVAASHACEESL